MSALLQRQVHVFRSYTEHGNRMKVLIHPPMKWKRGRPSRAAPVFSIDGLGLYASDVDGGEIQILNKLPEPGTES